MKTKLTRQITIEVALVVFGGMLIYAIFQYYAGEAIAIDLFVHHLWHTVLLAILIYAVLLYRLRALVFRPLEETFLHAYRMSTGNFEPHEYSTANNEIDDVTRMMNQMAIGLESITRQSWKEYADAMDRHLKYLQGWDKLTPGIHGELTEIRDNLLKMELTIGKVVEAGTRPSGPGVDAVAKSRTSQPSHSA